MRADRAFLIVALATGACGDKAAPRRAQDASAVSSPSAAQALASKGTGQGAPPASTFWAAQKLIRTGDVRIQVREVAAALKTTDSIARANETLLADSRTTQDAEGKRTAEILLRVPTQRFPAVVEALRGLGSVKEEAVSTQDITKEYADLETRLAVKEQTVGRLRALLDNRSAKLSDVLDVERELSRAVSELEQFKGERRYYDQQIALSTIKLVLFERAPSRMTQLGGPVSDALRNSLQVLGNSVGTIIYLIVAIAPWVFVTLAVVWVVKPLRRRFIATRPSESMKPPSAKPPPAA